MSTDTGSNTNTSNRFTTGTGTITAIFDGNLDLGAELFSGISDEEVSACLERAGAQPEQPIAGNLNAYVYQDGQNTILIDSGANGIMPGTGKLLDGLAQAGFRAEDIDKIICTHLHPDHIGGLITDNKAVFTNAELLVHEAETAFWQNQQYRDQAPEEFRVFFDLAASVLNEYGDRLSIFSKDGEIASGVNSVWLPGHTPGHCGLQIGDGNNDLFIWGDIVHVQALQMPQPKAAIAFDLDKDQAVATREKMFERACSEKLRIAGMHLLHPGIGYVTRSDDGYWMEPANPDG